MCLICGDVSKKRSPRFVFRSARLRGRKSTSLSAKKPSDGGNDSGSGFDRDDRE